MKKKQFIFFVILAIVACNPKKETSNQEIVQSKDEFVPFIERYELALDAIISPDAKIDIIAEGFDWTEGPLWIDGVGLLFTDIPPNTIYKWNEADGTKPYLSPSGYTGSNSRGGEMGSNGMLVDDKGNLILCQHGDRRIAMMDSPIETPKAVFKTIVDNYQGKKLNSPNDATFNKQGDLYFTDPAYGLEYMMDDPLKELDFQGVYRFAQSGKLSLLTNKMTRPNGIGFSPDQKTLYVANSDPDYAVWMAYQLNVNGEIEKEKVFYDATEFVNKEPGLPDGLKIDANGNVFASGPGGIWIFNDSGNVLGKIKTGQATSNCAFGENGKVLFITADMYVMKVDLR